jgi:hypothetical protein
VYIDRIYVSSASLPVGTPVTLQFGMDLAGSANVVDPSPTVDYSAELLVNRHSSQVLDLTGISSSGTVSTAVGDSLDVRGSLFVALSANGAPSGTSPYSYSIACDLMATFPVASLTPGVVLSSNSGTLGVPADGAPIALALEGAQPNPAHAGAIAIRFTLPGNAPATLALYDIAGRLVDSRDVR